MKSRLDEALAGNEANYLLPFLWQRGEDEAVIREEMQRVYEAGIRAVCVEARPHPDFLGERWWRDMDIIMEEARQHNMRVWVLDDDHFPTGHAAGKVVDAPAALHRRFLHEHHLDVLGPQKHASLLVKPVFMNLFNPSVTEGATLLAVIAARRSAESDRLSGEMIDLTAMIVDDILYWDIPEGTWRVFFLITSPSGGSERHKDYVNPLAPESVKILLDAVYEPFYARYGDDFGQTFAGFFSDEPGFYNDRESFDYHSGLGKQGVSLPWRGDLLALLEKQGGQDFLTRLPLLWHEGDARTASTRYVYMDVVSRLYGQHFTNQLGDWCRAHRVEYIGHVLEDNGVHTRLGCGAGHFFRALWGQDMSGIDIVLWQVVPGFDNGPFTNVSGDGDGEFYHYGLAKLGSSLGHIDPKKHGRTMCELFGAYGWREGLKLMKWMTDHLLVRGVNYFVPHAFSQAEFPDPDCPPHFFARGKNPQYRYYRLLNQYTNRISHLLTGGVHVAPTAVLYHAEAEWAGPAMPFQKPVKALAQHQIDCDVLPGDVLTGASMVNASRLIVGSESYQTLVVPASQVLPTGLLQRLVELADAGLPLIFVEHLPEHTCNGAGGGALLERLAAHPMVRITTLNALAQVVRDLGFAEIETSSFQPYLRSYHIHHDQIDVFFLTNEHPYTSVETEICLPGQGPALVYDAFQNRVAPLDSHAAAGRVTFNLHLSPYESSMVALGEGARQIASLLAPPAVTAQGNPAEMTLGGPWSIATATAEQYPVFEAYLPAAALADLSQASALPAFSGTFRYETSFDLPRETGSAILDLGEVYETAEIWVNQKSAGVRICPPYRFEIGALLQAGPNHLVVEVTNTLVKQQRDFLSRFTHQEPSGLLGPVSLRYQASSPEQ